MDGYTDALVVRATETWWPTLADLALHPLHPDRSFFAAVSDAAVAFSDSASSVGLSRLGRSVFLTATLITDDAATWVRVWNPFSSTEMRLCVVQCPHALVLHTGQPVSDLVLASRVRVVAAKTPAAQPMTSVAVDPHATRMALYEARVRHTLLSFLQAQHACGTRSGDGYCGILFSGAADGATNAVLRRLRAHTQGSLDVRKVTRSSSRDAAALLFHGTHYTVEHRVLNLAQVCSLDAREAVAVVAAVLQPPLTARATSDAVSRPLVVVTLEHVDLLWLETSAQAPLVVNSVAQELSLRLDQLACGSGAVFCVWSVTDDTVVPSTPLVRRLARHGHVRGLDSHPCSTTLPITPVATPDTTWHASLFGLDAVVQKLEELLVWPLTRLVVLRELNLSCPRGVLLCGPSGSGKTALLTALARHLRQLDTAAVHVLVVDALTLLTKEVGRTEQNVASLFARARAHAPTALFLDNLDALAPPRGRRGTEHSTTTDRTLSTLLTEMDGVGADGRIVVVLAAAPSRAVLDAAVCRPGRLDVHLTLPGPTPKVAGAVVVKRLSAFATRTGQTDTTWQDAVRACTENYVAAATGVVSAAQIVAAVRDVLLRYTVQPDTPWSAAVLVGLLRDALDAVCGSPS